MITDEEAEAILAQRETQRGKARRRRVNHYLLSGVIRCTCGANMDGDSGFYRCHDRCGTRGIKKETLEQAVLDLLFDELLTLDNLCELKDAISQEAKGRNQGQDHLLEQLSGELKEIERQIGELVGLLSQARHQRPLLERLDQLEDERLTIAEQLSSQQNDTAESPIINYDGDALTAFLQSYRDNLECDDVEKKKAMLRSVIDHGVFDGETLTLHPSYEELAGVKLASPRGGHLIPQLRASSEIITIL